MGEPMALTLDISPDMETLLRLKAARSGQDITGYLLELVKGDLSVDLSEYDGMEDYAASVAGVQAGIEDFNSGNSISFEEWCAREAERKEERRHQKQNTHTAEKVA